MVSGRCQIVYFSTFICFFLLLTFNFSAFLLSSFSSLSIVSFSYYSYFSYFSYFFLLFLLLIFFSTLHTFPTIPTFPNVPTLTFPNFPTFPIFYFSTVLYLKASSWSYFDCLPIPRALPGDLDIPNRVL